MHAMAIAEEMSDIRQPQNKPDSADAHDFACKRVTTFENVPRLLCKDQSIICPSFCHVYFLVESFTFWLI